MRSIFFGLVALAFAGEDCQVADESTMLQIGNRKVAGAQANAGSTLASSSMKDLQRATSNSTSRESMSSQEEWCTNGIKGGRACCAASCGTCRNQNRGCRQAPGGRSQCCKDSITRRGRECTSASDTACRIPDPLWPEHRPERPINPVAGFIDGQAEGQWRAAGSPDPPGQPAPIGAWCLPEGTTEERALCGGGCRTPIGEGTPEEMAAAEYIANQLPWCQGVGWVDFGREPSECPARIQVANQRECQNLASYAGHEFYNFGYCEATGKYWCITVEECNVQPVLPPWQMYKAP